MANGVGSNPDLPKLNTARLLSGGWKLKTVLILVLTLRSIVFLDVTNLGLSKFWGRSWALGGVAIGDELFREYLG